MDQACLLLRHRCSLIAFDERLDMDALKNGSTIPCIKVLRYLFLRFSEALSIYLEEENCHFDGSMSDTLFLQSVIDSIHILSSRPGALNWAADKLLSPGLGLERLLFTLQCIFLCAEKHRELIQEVKYVDTCQESSQSMISFNQWPDDRALDGSVGTSEDDKLQNWMAQVYRAQLSDVTCTSESAFASEEKEYCSNGKECDFSPMTLFFSSISKDFNEREEGVSFSDDQLEVSFINT